jgi:hypothetical protein
MFEYCRRVLCFRENEAYLRITVARAAREHPVLLEMLRDGRLHLSGIARLAPHLTHANVEAVLKRACGMSHREIRELVSELEPRPDVAPSVRKLPQRLAPGSASPLLGAPRVESDAVSLESRVAAPARPPVVEPLAPSRYQVRFTASAELREKLERDGDHGPANLTLMCRTHNTLVAEQDYGEDVVARFRVATSRACVPVDAYGARIVVQPRWLSSG